MVQVLALCFFLMCCTCFPVKKRFGGIYVQVRMLNLGNECNFQWYFTGPRAFGGILRKSQSFSAMRPIFPSINGSILFAKKKLRIRTIRAIRPGPAEHATWNCREFVKLSRGICFQAMKNATKANFVQLCGENLWMRIYRALLLAKHNHALSSANNNSFSKKKTF